MSRINALLPSDVLRRLWQADSPGALARDLLHALAAAHPDDAIVWSVNWPHRFDCEPEPACHRIDRSALLTRVEAARIGNTDEHPATVLCDDGESCIALFVGPAQARFDALPEPVRNAWCKRMRELLQASAQALAEQRAEQAERMQRALFTIADITGSDLSPAQMLRGLQRVLNELMPADRFEAVAYDPAQDQVHWLHRGDGRQPDAARDPGSEPLSTLAGTPIGHVLAEARTLAADSTVSLERLTVRAEAAANRLELLLATLHELPDGRAGGAGARRVVRHRARSETEGALP